MTHAAHIDDFVPCERCGDCLACDPHSHGPRENQKGMSESEKRLTAYQAVNDHAAACPNDPQVSELIKARARIAADAETIKAERARADRYEAESEQKGADLMAAEGTIEDLKAASDIASAIIEDNDATRTIRDLRETIDDLHLMLGGIKHYPVCSPEEPCLRCQLEAARETVRKQAEEIERLKLELATERDAGLLAQAFSGREEERAELATLREQVETLREALAHLVDTFGIYPNGKGLTQAVNALAATEPKQ